MQFLSVPGAYYDQLRLKLAESPVKIKEDLSVLQVISFYGVGGTEIEVNKNIFRSLTFWWITTTTVTCCNYSLNRCRIDPPCSWRSSNVTITR